MLQAIIFDFDGVIVDSEPLHFKATQSTLAGLGIHLDSHTHLQECIGYPDADNFKRLSSKFQLEMNEEQLQALLATKTEHYRQLVAQQAHPCPGAIALIKAAAKEYPLAICSGSFRAELVRLLASIDHEDLNLYFKQIITIESVRAGKPDPAGYRLAAERLNVLPEFCLAIEDSPAGIIAAKTAGMKVLAVTSTHPQEKLTLADRCVKSLTDITLSDLANLCRT